MPGYGILGPEEGTGLLAWVEVAARFAASHDYWVATTWPDGRPHVMPVWGSWDGAAFWFSSGGRSRKVQNLRRDPRCVVTGDDAHDPVVVDGLAEVIEDLADIEAFLARLNAKYATSYDLAFLDPALNATVRVRPRSAFALLQRDFAGSPTRWTFPDA